MSHGHGVRVIPHFGPRVDLSPVERIPHVSDEEVILDIEKKSAEYRQEILEMWPRSLMSEEEWIARTELKTIEFKQKLTKLIADIRSKSAIEVERIKHARD